MTGVINSQNTEVASLQHSSQETAVFLNKNQNGNYVSNETTDETSNESSPDSPTHSDSTETTQVTTTNSITSLKNKKITANNNNSTNGKIMSDFISKGFVNQKKLSNFENSSSTATDSDDSCVTKTFTKPSIPSSMATTSLTNGIDENEDIMNPISFKNNRRSSSSLSEAEDDQIAKFRRESIKNYKGMGGVSWGSLSIGAWLKDEIMFNKLQDAITIRLQQEEEQKLGSDPNESSFLFASSKENDLLSTFDDPPSLIKQKIESEKEDEEVSNVNNELIEPTVNLDDSLQKNSTNTLSQFKKPTNVENHFNLKPQASYLPTLEQKYCKDYSCCGITLPSLHDLLNHYEQSHVPGSHTTGNKLSDEIIINNTQFINKQPNNKQQSNFSTSGKPITSHSFSIGENMRKVHSYNVFHNVENKLNLKTIGELLPNENKNYTSKKQLVNHQNNQQEETKKVFLNNNVAHEKEQVVSQSVQPNLKFEPVNLQRGYKSYSMSNAVDVGVQNYRQINSNSTLTTTPPPNFGKCNFTSTEKVQQKERTASPQAISKPLSPPATSAINSHDKFDLQTVVDSHKTTTTEDILEEAKALIGIIQPTSMRNSKSLDINLTIKTNDSLDIKNKRTIEIDGKLQKRIIDKKETKSFIGDYSSSEKPKFCEHNDMDDHGLHSDLDMDALDEADLKVMVELGKITNDGDDGDDENLENNGNNDQQNNNGNDEDKNNEENNKDEDEEDDEERDEDEEQNEGQPPIKKRKINVKSVGIPDEPFMRSKTFVEDEDKPFRCPVIGCDKAYKNQNGLKYHRAHGHEGQILQENNDGTFSVINPETNLPFNEFVEFELDKPYRCEGCGRRYKNLNGLKYHKAHSTH
ncbi:hypothetical protein HANVADRAFT_51295 [Hanseniaspora valbyensis NRRL Y-1626]|uniref:C2H2-type domain-containing protein n=1 Tax=Hanseniaspora valbyensis NRRL Y-1626 TaxID=766949 RepID=A0A1B7TJC8_9ASCO|nr:hypothetical protein HANVADRAFT_51295 [Hanseniaspora valbyensis NRRL Y-1626]